MMVAGLWRRPAYYGEKGRAAEAVIEEVRAVRENVGLIDVSTLGGLNIRGPDAAEFVVSNLGLCRALSLDNAEC